MADSLHPKIKKFDAAMLHEQEANANKGLWEDWSDVDDILLELEYHKAKLLLALKEADKAKVKEYIADCANILLCLGNAGHLYSEPTGTESFV